MLKGACTGQYPRLSSRRREMPLIVSLAARRRPMILYGANHGHFVNARAGYRRARRPRHTAWRENAIMRVYLLRVWLNQKEISAAKRQLGCSAKCARSAASSSAPVGGVVGLSWHGEHRPVADVTTIFANAIGRLSAAWRCSMTKLTRNRQ